MTLDKKYLLDMVERENDIQADFIAGEYRNKFYVTHTYHHTIDPALFGVSKISSKTKFEARKVTENPNAILFQTRAEDKYALAEEMRDYYHHELEINSWGGPPSTFWNALQKGSIRPLHSTISSRHTDLIGKTLSPLETSKTIQTCWLSQELVMQ